MDKPKAVTAAARKLARLAYAMLTKGEEYTDKAAPRRYLSTSAALSSLDWPRQMILFSLLTSTAYGSALMLKADCSGFVPPAPIL
jgi:hypothetical protein